MLCCAAEASMVAKLNGCGQAAPPLVTISADVDPVSGAAAAPDLNPSAAAWHPVLLQRLECAPQSHRCDSGRTDVGPLGSQMRCTAHVAVHVYYQGVLVMHTQHTPISMSQIWRGPLPTRCITAERGAPSCLEAVSPRCALRRHHQNHDLHSTCLGMYDVICWTCTQAVVSNHLSSHSVLAGML
jgi:hypothetical protein